MNANTSLPRPTHRPLVAAALGAALLTLGTGAQAQMQREMAGGGYVGLQVGRSDYQLPCGNLYHCDDRDTSVKLSLGRNISPHFGAELSLADFGNAGRAGGDTRAQAANLSLVGRVPVDRFTLFGKVGTSYGRTRVNTAVLSDIPSGKASGWGPSAGLGVSYELSPGMALVAEWERQRLNFAGTGKADVDNTSVGLRWQY